MINQWKNFWYLEYCHLIFCKKNIQVKNKILVLGAGLLCSISAISQIATADYPEPGTINEIYFWKKDSGVILLSLEKGSSKLDTKSKMAGFGGAESGYSLQGETSPVRLNNSKSLSFLFSTNVSSGSTSRLIDSMMKANGIDPASLKGVVASATDPANSITLYKTEPGKGIRKILMMKGGGAMPFSSKKTTTSDKFTFTVKKIREGYWELVIDKILLKGEYAFTLAAIGVGSKDGSIPLFAFGVD